MTIDQVDEIKSKADIVTVIGEYIDLKKAGRNFKSNCPFHSEKTPSFVVSPELQIFKCFGCGESGDVFSFLQKHEGMDFYEALKLLAEKTGVKLVTANFQGRSEKQKLYELNAHVGRFYHYILLNHPSGKRALSYLTSDRGLTMDSIKEFQIGFSPDVPFALKKFIIEKKGFNLKQLDKAGLIYRRGSNVFDRFRGRVVFPLHDNRGNVVGFAGRAMPGAAKTIAKYINTPETPVYHKSNILYGLNFTKREIKKANTAIVVEGELDMISTWQVGVKNAVALKGSAFTKEQAKLIARYANKVVMALDADVAGDKATRRGIEIVEAEGLEVSVARLVGYKDPDEMAHKDPKGLVRAFRKTISIWDYLIDLVFEKYDTNSGSNLAKISREVVPILNSISDSIVQAHYISYVAQKMGVDDEVVAKQVAKQKSVLPDTRIVPSEVGYVDEEKYSREELLERRLLTLIFSHDHKLFAQKRYASILTSPFTKKLLGEYTKYMKSHRTFKTASFAENLPKEMVDGFAEIILLENLPGLNRKGVYNYEAPIDENPEKEIDLVEGELLIAKTKEKLTELTTKIKEFEKNRQKTKLKKAQMQFSKLSAELSDLEEKYRM